MDSAVEDFCWWLFCFPTVPIAFFENQGIWLTSSEVWTNASKRLKIFIILERLTSASAKACILYCFKKLTNKI